MAGTKQGGINARNTNIEKYGEDFYKKIGTIGGKIKSKDKGFGGMDAKKRSEAGRKGGTISRRGAKQ